MAKLKKNNHCFIVGMNFQKPYQEVNTIISNHLRHCFWIWAHSSNKDTLHNNFFAGQSLISNPWLKVLLRYKRSRQVVVQGVCSSLDDRVRLTYGCTKYMALYRLLDRWIQLMDPVSWSSWGICTSTTLQDLPKWTFVLNYYLCVAATDGWVFQVRVKHA